MINSPLKGFICFLFFSIVTLSFSQKKVITALNQHFYPINEGDTVNLTYQAILTNSGEKNTLEMTYDMQNRVVRIIQGGYNEEGSFREQIIENFDQKGKLTSRKTKNLDNGMFHAAYYEKDVFLGEVVFKGFEQFEITKSGQSSIVLVAENEFEPAPQTDKLLWQKFLINNLRYPRHARDRKETGTVLLAFNVNMNSELVKIEVANPSEVSSSLAVEALRVANLYQGKFRAATNLNGYPIEAWLYIPLRFKLN